MSRRNKKGGSAYSKQVKTFARENNINLHKNKFFQPNKGDSNTKKTKAERRKIDRRYLMGSNGKKQLPAKERKYYHSSDLKKYPVKNGSPVTIPKVSNRQAKLKAKVLKAPNSSFGQRYKQQQQTRQQQVSKRLNNRARAGALRGSVLPDDYYKLFPLQPVINSMANSDEIDSFVGMINNLNNAVSYIDFQNDIKISFRQNNYLKSHYRNMLNDFKNINTYYQLNDWFGRDNKNGKARKDMGYRLMKDFIWPNCNNLQNMARAMKILSKQLDDWTGDWQIVYYRIMG